MLHCSRRHRLKNKVLYTVFLIAAVIAVGLAAVFTPQLADEPGQTPITAEAVSIKKDVNSLSSVSNERWLIVGTNYLSTGMSGASSANFAVTLPSSGASATFGDNGVQFGANARTISATLPFMTGYQMNDLGGIFNVLSNGDVEVGAYLNMKVNLTATPAQNFVLTVTLGFFNGAETVTTSSSVTYTTSDSAKTIEPMLGLDDAAIRSILYDAGNGTYTGIGSGSCFTVSVAATAPEGSTLSPTTLIPITFSNVALDITAEIASLKLNPSVGVNFTVTGNNRVPYMVKNATGAAAVYDITGTIPQSISVDDIYVKTGDLITFTTASFWDAQLHPYNEYFSYTFGTRNTSCIMWKTYLTNYSSSATYLSRIESQTNIAYPDVSQFPGGATSPEYIEALNIYYGYTASFVVTAGALNAALLNIKPLVVKGVAGGEQIYDNNEPGDETVALNVDAIAPKAPIIDSTSPLGTAIASQKWFTDSSSVFLKYSSGETGSINNETNVSEEKVYAFIVSSDISTVNLQESVNIYNIKNPLSPLSAFSFSPEANGGTMTYYYKLNNVEYSSRRQDLGSFRNTFEHSEDEALKKRELVFSYDGSLANAGGTFSLVLYGVDAAGNVSSPKVYSTANNNSVRADSKSYDVGAYFAYGTNAEGTIIRYTGASGPTVLGRYGEVYIYGNSSHTYDSTKQTFVCSDLTFATSSMQRTAKRGDWVTVRLRMNETQYSNYMPISWATTSNTLASTDLIYKNHVETVGGKKIPYRYYDVTYQITDEIAAKTQEGMVTFFFSRKADIKLLANGYSFNRSTITVADDLEVYFSGPGEENYFRDNHLPQPQLTVEYFKRQTYYVYVRLDEAGVVTTGGYFLINGVQYPVAEDVDLLTYFSLAQNEFEFTDADGNHSYKAVSYIVSTKDANYGRYIINGYDTLAGQSTGFVDAGNYYWKATLVNTKVTAEGSALSYQIYGVSVGLFEIKKASPNVRSLEAAPLTYGTSLANLQFLSLDLTNSIITSTLTHKGIVYQLSASGCYGVYRVENIQSDSIDYIRHRVGVNIPLTVKFYPIDVITDVSPAEIAANWEFYSNFYTFSGGKYVLIPGTQHAGNYDVQLIDITININHAAASVYLEGYDNVTFTYDGSEKHVSAFAYIDSMENVLAGEPLLIKYKAQGAPDTAFTTTAPTNAGTYVVRITINTSSSNYMSEAIDRTVIIYKRALDISLDDCPEKTNVSGNYSGNNYVAGLTFAYGYTKVSDFTAYFTKDGVTEDVPGLVYSFSFLKIIDYAGNNVSSTWSDETSVITATYLGAGTYMMKVSIINSNNEGIIYILYTVNQGSTSDGGHLTVISNAISTSRRTASGEKLTAYDMNGVSQGAGHLEYGETLASASSQLITNGKAQYIYRTSSAKVDIPGRFFFETETEYYGRTGYAGEYPRNAAGEVIFDVKYDGAGRLVYYRVNMYWEAGSYVSGNFVADTNFARTAIITEIYVCRSEVDFSNVRLKSVVYGNPLGALTLETGFNTPTAHDYELTPSQYTLTYKAAGTENLILAAGTRTVVCEFSLNGDAARRFLADATVSITVIVQPRALAVAFPGTQNVTASEYGGTENGNGLVHRYGSAYSVPSATVTYQDNGNPVTGGVSLNYYFLRLKTSPSEVPGANESEFNLYEGFDDYIRVNSITSSTPVGRYLLLADSQSGNYTVYQTVDFFIVKGNLTTDTVFGILYIEYGSALSEAALPAAGWAYASDNTRFYGSFSFLNPDYTPDVTPQIVLDSVANGLVTDLTHYFYDLVFTPSSGGALYANFNPVSVKCVVLVEKRTLTIPISGLSLTFNNTARSAVIGQVANPEGGFFSVTTRYYRATDTGFTTPVTPLEAGTYIVRSILDPTALRYRGAEVAALVINKAVADINTDEIILTYNGAVQPITVDYSLPGISGIALLQDYLNIQYFDKNGFAMDSPPSAVGGYTARVSIVQPNITGTADIRVFVQPWVASVAGLEQTYSANIAPVSLVYTDPAGSAHPNVSYSVRYRKSGEEEFSSEPGDSAGVYDVEIVFSENGYDKIWTRTMNVGKATATFNLNTVYYTAYTGSPISFSVALPMGVARANYYFTYEGTENSPEILIDAGRYSVRIVLNDNNYQGEGVTVLVVNKGILTVESRPVISDIPFNTLDTSGYFVPAAGGGNSGSVKFRTTGADMTQLGVWSIETDISGYTVGVHDVTALFTPASVGGVDYFANFAPVSVTVSVNIVKRDISSLIKFVTSTLTQTYSDSALRPSAYVDGEGVIIDGYGTISLILYYSDGNNNETRKNVGTYNVKAVVNDNNYRGESGYSIFEIKKATPVPVYPAFVPIPLGATLVASGLNYSFGGNVYSAVSTSGTAFIPGTGRVIEGTFSFSAAFTLNKANVNYVGITFTPADNSSFNSVAANVPITVNGTDLAVTVSSVTSPGGAVYYGQPLSAFVITAVASDSVTTAPVPGTVEWVNPNAVIPVGGLAAYKFVPSSDYIDGVPANGSYYEKYNVYYGNYAVNIEPSVLQLVSADMRVYVGDPIANAVITLSLINITGGAAVTDYNVALSPSNSAAILNYVGLEADCDSDPDDGIAASAFSSVLLLITGSNFEPFEVSVPLRVFRYVGSKTNYREGFSVTHNSKYYDGNAVGLYQIGIVPSNSEYHLGFEDFRILSILKDGETANEIREAGTYTVTVRIDESILNTSGAVVYYGSHDGYFVFDYIVMKRDLSSDIAVTGNVKTYGDSSVKLAVTYGAFTSQVSSSYVIIEYLSADKSLSYGALAPQSAGSYFVRVSFSDADPSFRGSAEFNYTVNKKAVTVTVDSSYVFSYGETVSIVPEFGNSTAASGYTVSYKLSGSTESTYTVPQNVGTYTVTITVTHNNYTGSAICILNIRQATLTLEEEPTFGTLEYGVALGNCIISDGKVALGGTGATVDGTFGFVYPELNNLSVGVNSVLVRFTPQNSNYAPLTFSRNITVKKASASINFDNSVEYVYNGAAQLPAFTTAPVAGIAVAYSIRKDGSVVPAAVAAGIYVFTITISDTNYEGSATFTMTIKKAQVIVSESRQPSASSITYGKALKNSSLTGGSLVYISGKSAVRGEFAFVNGDTVLGSVGTYSVEYKFTPEDTVNYESYRAFIDIKVIKAFASITVSGTEFTYGDIVTSPVFTSEYGSLNIINSEFETQYHNKRPKVGSYTCTAVVNEENYEGSVTYTLIIKKKLITLIFYNGETAVDAYTTTFGSIIYAKARINPASLALQDYADIEEIEKYIGYRYGLLSASTTPTSLTPPTDAGAYVVYAYFEYADYYIAPDTRINYTINRAEVTSLKFEFESLSNQVYGSVVRPIVITQPAGINVTVSFVGYADMPTIAGTHTIILTVNDKNYMPKSETATFRILPKTISVENLKAYNKPYDGFSAIEVTGELKGVIVGDEVLLKLTAHTLNDVSTVGTHQVELLTYKLSGQAANNYILAEPIYSLTAKITKKVVTDPETSSYITSDAGFSTNVTVDFSEVYDSVNESNFFTKLLGQKALVQVITVKENGLNTVLDTKVKFYVKIPDQYLGSPNLKVEALGELANQNIQFKREGDYYTFYSDMSGQIVFYDNTFPYWVIIAIGAAAILVIGALLVVFLSPVRRRKKLSRQVRATYDWTQRAEGMEIKHEKDVAEKYEDYRRKWRW